MKGKTLLCLSVLIPLLVTMLRAIAPVAAHPTTFYLDPANITWTCPPHNIGDEFNLALRVDAVTDMYLWVVTIEWDPAVFDLVGDPAEGWCLNSGGGTLFIQGNITDGKIEEMVCTLSGLIPGVNVPPAPNDMATITLKTQKYTEGTTINVTFARYIDSAGTEYAPEATSTHFKFTPTPPVGGFWVPVDKLDLLAPYIALASTILVATAATAIYVKRVKRGKEKQ